MLIGHYSAAFVAKVVEPRVPLWIFLLAAQWVDVFWSVFVLTGVERVRLDPTLSSNPLDLYHMPYTHSLVGTGVWALAAGLVVARVARFGGTVRSGVVVALVVASHWGLDILVHRPDLTLWGVPPKLGLGLWDVPSLAYLLELALVAGGAAFYAARSGLPSQGLKDLAFGLVGLAILQTVFVLGPIPTSVSAVVSGAFVVFVGVAYAGWQAERRANRTAKSPS